MAQVWRSHVSFVREQTYGSTGSGSAVYIPVLTYDTWEDNRERVLDNAFRAVPSKDFAVYSGVNSGRTGYTWYFYPDVMGRFLKGIFGAEAVTQTTVGNRGVHTFGSTDTPASETIYDFYGVAGSERRFHGSQMQSMNLSFETQTGALQMKNEWLSFAASTGISETTFSYTGTSGVIPHRGWQATLALANSTNLRLLRFNVDLKRAVDLIYGANNSQNPSAREVGPLEITGSLSFYGGTSSGGSTETEYTLFRNNTSTSMVIDLQDSTAALSTANGLTLTFSNANFYPATLDRSGNYVRWDVPFRALHNVTDSGPAAFALAIASTAVTT